MGTSTGGTTNHGTSAVAITNHDYLSQETVAEIKTSPETSEKEMEADGTSAQKAEEGENSGNQMLSISKLTVDQVEKRNKADSMCDMSSLSESLKRIGEGRWESFAFCFLYVYYHYFYFSMKNQCAVNPE